MAAILLVEDEPLSRMVAEATLRALGFAVLATADGATAIALARAEAVLEILFTDVHLLPGPDGWEVARVVRRIHPGIRVIYTSGQVDADQHARFGVPGSCLLPKPYTPEELTMAIDGRWPPLP
jgi:CheY-like chemotaxis protein